MSKEMPINLKVSTKGKGKPLVLLHGWGVNSGVWDPLVQLISDKFCITTIDIPGYGQNNQVLPSPYSLENVSQTIAEHLPEDCILVGWSLGGLIAQNIAISFPNKLSQLILVCASPKFSRNEEWPGIDPSVLAMFMQQLTQDFAKTLDRFLAIQAMGSPSARQDVKSIRHSIKQHPEPSDLALSAGLDLLKKSDLRAGLKTLTVPCHMLLGEQDSLVPKKIATLIPTLAPNIEIEVMPKTSHAPFISDTKSFAKSLIKAVDRGKKMPPA